MAYLPSSSFLSHLRSIYPQKSLSNYNPWYIAAAVAFCSSNVPKAVPYVFLQALEDLRVQGAEVEEQLLLARKVRDALFKAGLTAGYSRSINSLIALHEVMPEELRDTKPPSPRRTEASLEEYEKIGQDLFRSIYGETTDSVQGLVDTIYPGLGWFTTTVGYGVVYGDTNILSQLETSYVLIAALIASDTPLQIQWHLDGARRGGATFEEAQAIRKISMEVASAAGVQWKDGVPEAKDNVV